MNEMEYIVLSRINELLGTIGNKIKTLIDVRLQTKHVKPQLISDVKSLEELNTWLNENVEEEYEFEIKIPETKQYTASLQDIIDDLELTLRDE